MKEKIIFTLEKREIVLIITIFFVFSVALFLLGFFTGSRNCSIVATKPRVKEEKVVVTPSAEKKSVEYVFSETTNTEKIVPSKRGFLESATTSVEVIPPSGMETLKVVKRKGEIPVRKRIKVQKRKIKKVSSHPSELVKKLPSPPLKIEKPYTIQVAAYKNKKDALLLIYKLRKRGFRAYFQRVNILGRGIWYRVRIGHFPTKEKASQIANRVRRETSLPTFITISR